MGCCTPRTIFLSTDKAQRCICKKQSEKRRDSSSLPFSLSSFPIGRKEDYTDCRDENSTDWGMGVL